MNPLEQLKILHSEALTRLSQHPDFQLIKQLEPIIDALENPEIETSESHQESTDTVTAENDEVTDAQVELTSNGEEELQTGNETAAFAAAAVSAEMLDIDESTEQTSADIEEDMTDVPAPGSSFDEVTAVKAELEEVMSANAEQNVELVAEDAEETDPLVSQQTELQSETSTAAPAVSLDPVSAPIVEATVEEPTVELDATDFETEEAFIGSIDQELSDALANTDFAAEVAATAENTDSTDIEDADKQEQVQTEASTEADAELDIDIEKELSIEALIDEQVAKLLSEERPV